MNGSRAIASHVQILFDSGTLAGLPDGQLLDRYAREGDQEAFELIAGRHGPMVLGVCRRILADPSDVDDAFQATFLVLIRRAAALGSDVVLAAWLHGVASKVARRARSDRLKRWSRERRIPIREASPAGVPPPDFALRRVIDEELERLPWKYRAPVALCYLEGLTHEEAALRLGWPVGSVKGRLARARALLGPRLVRRGATAGTVAAAMEGLAGAAVPDVLRCAVVVAAGRIARGAEWRVVVSHQVVQLARGVFASMILTKLKSATLIAAAAGLMATGVGVAARHPTGADRPADVPPPVVEPGATAAPGGPSLSSRDVTPEERLLAGVRAAYLAAMDDYKAQRSTFDRVARTSKMLLEAQLSRARTPLERSAALAEHRDRMLTVAQTEHSERQGLASVDAGVAEAKALVAEAELWLDRGAGLAPADSTPGGGPSEVSGDRNPKTAEVLLRLNEPIAMNFPNETPLEDVLKYIKQVTSTPNDQGIPIYVDPIGLSEADRTSTSPISLDLQGVPLRRTLQLMLKQIGMAYFVEDGMIVITSAASAGALDPPMARPSALLLEVEKASRGEMTAEGMKALSEKLKMIQEIRKLHDEIISVHDTGP